MTNRGHVQVLRDALVLPTTYIPWTAYARLHRSLSPAADFRFVNVAVWQSPQAFQAAISQPGFTATPVPFPFHASLYQVVHEDQR